MSEVQDPRHPGRLATLFERFTPPARQVVVHAQDAARSFGHDYIGAEHLLLGLIREERGLAARLLASLGVTEEAARTRLLETVAPGELPVTGQIQFMPDAVETLEASRSEADRMGHGFVGTEHVLLGLTRQADSLAAGVLRDLGHEPDEVRDAVVRAISRDNPV